MGTVLLFKDLGEAGPLWSMSLLTSSVSEEGCYVLSPWSLSLMLLNRRWLSGLQVLYYLTKQKETCRLLSLRVGEEPKTEEEIMLIVMECWI